MVELDKPWANVSWADSGYSAWQLVAYYELAVVGGSGTQWRTRLLCHGWRDSLITFAVSH